MTAAGMVARLRALEIRRETASPPVTVSEFLDAVNTVELAMRAGMAETEIAPELLRRARGCPPDIRQAWVEVDRLHPAGEWAMRSALQWARSATHQVQGKPRPLMPLQAGPWPPLQEAELHRIAGDHRIDDEDISERGFSPAVVAAVVSIRSI